VKKEKAVYWWVSVAGSHCEPAVVRDNKAYTLGCPDPFDLTQVDCPLKLIEKCDVPLTPKQELYLIRKENKKLREMENHGYRKF
jgi:hypothetical protein